MRWTRIPAEEVWLLGLEINLLSDTLSTPPTIPEDPASTLKRIWLDSSKVSHVFYFQRSPMIEQGQWILHVHVSFKSDLVIVLIVWKTFDERRESSLGYRFLPFMLLVSKLLLRMSTLPTDDSSSDLQDCLSNIISICQFLINLCQHHLLIGVQNMHFEMTLQLFTALWK